MLTKLSCNHDPNPLNKFSKKMFSRGVEKKQKKQIENFRFYYLNTFYL